MNAHVCLSATFGWHHLWQVRHWGRRVRGVIVRWLLAFGLHCGVPHFYLWDLLPAIYLSYPELFDKNRTALGSTVQDLTSGTLVVSQGDPGAQINMPTCILRLGQLRSILFDAWLRTDLKAYTFAQPPQKRPLPQADL
jgi:hypothetical protein